MRHKYNSPLRDVPTRLEHVEMALDAGNCRDAGMLLIAAATEAGKAACRRKNTAIPHLKRLLALQDQIITQCHRRRNEY